MFKLVAVGGKIRGTEIVLADGENTLGRSDECNHKLQIEGVSKKHLRVTVNGDTAYIEDLGSSNGTYVNGKFIKKQTVVNGDKVALPNVIFQVVHVEEKKIIIKKQVAKVSNDAKEVNELEDFGEMPNDLIGKIKFIFKYKVMPVFYGFNEQYEWKYMLGILLFIFIAINIALTIFPVLRDSKMILISEMAKRGAHYADEIARLNARALERKDLDKLNTNFLDGEDGVVSYELFDLDGRIVRPIGKLNQYTTDTFSIETKTWVANDKEKSKQVLQKFLDDGEIGIGKSIMAYDVKLGQEVPVGIIAIRFSPRSLSLEAAQNSKAYLEALVTSALVALLFYFIIYLLTTRHIEEMKIQIEQALRGRRKEVESKLLMSELSPLRSSINSILQRIRELQNDPTAEANNTEEDTPYVRRLKEFMMGSNGPVLVLNSQKLISHLNTECEDLLGIRESSQAGTSMLDSARDQGIAATVIDLCDKSASSDGVNQSESYELKGHPHTINVVALMGKDTFAKAFYVTFVKGD